MEIRIPLLCLHKLLTGPNIGSIFQLSLKTISSSSESIPHLFSSSSSYDHPENVDVSKEKAFCSLSTSLLRPFLAILCAYTSVSMPGEDKKKMEDRERGKEMRMESSKEDESLILSEF